MCGIAGIHHKQSQAEIERMLEKIQHRGPDGQGIKTLSRGTLGHRCLAIKDIEGCQQPMGVAGVWIVFDGEIYNDHELAREYLDSKTLATHSDAEVLVRLYQKYGPPCVKLLHGMFAFAIMKEDELFLARDPIGLKPLYFGGQNGSFYFASEIKALAGLTSTIHEFPAGHWYHSNQGWKTYHEFSRGTFEINTKAEAIMSIRKILKDAVHLRLIADVPVGLSLSGGLNSSIIAMLASRDTKHLHSFAVGMQGSEDLEAARKTAKVVGTHHHERIYTEAEMLSVLPKVIYHLESFEPALVRSAIPKFFLAEMAAQYVKVILLSEGADEIYAGHDNRNFNHGATMFPDQITNMNAVLHNPYLRRSDRIPMAFALETRVPFLDVRSIALALALPEEWKFRTEQSTKFLLRQVFAADLPEEIVTRPMQKFLVGTGSADVLAQIAKREISDEEFQVEHHRLLMKWDYRLPSKEALYYYRLLRKDFEDRWIFPSIGQS